MSVPPLSNPGVFAKEEDVAELADIIMVMQRCFLVNLSKDLARGKVSFSQFLLLGFLEQFGVLSMSEIASKMNHSTAAATGLVDRLENLGYLERAHTVNDRRKVLVKVTEKGREFFGEIRAEMIENLKKCMEVLTEEEQSMWLVIYQKILNFCQRESQVN